MSFKDCIDRGEANGSLNADQAKEARDLYGSLYDQYRKIMNPAEAQARAAGDAYKTIDFKKMEAKRRKLIAATVIRDINNDISKYRNTKGELDTVSAVKALFVQDHLAPYNNLEFMRSAVSGMAFSSMDKFLKKFRRNLVGRTKHKADLKNIVRESFGEETSDASAREMFQAYYQAEEYLRKRANASGMNIARLENRGLNQSHHSLKIRQAGYKTWRDFTLARLDLDKMVDESTNLPFTPASIEPVINEVYQTIITNGFNRIDPMKYTAGSFATRKTDHRFLKFKNADSWMEYQNKFGESNAFDTMVSHVEALSRDVAILERLGPNPKATMEFLKKKMLKEANVKGDAKSILRAQKISEDIQTYYNIMSGNYSGISGNGIPAGIAGLRQVLQSAQLGSASIAAITDINFQRLARQMNGLPQTSIISDYLKNLMGLGLGERQMLATRLGISADEFTTVAATLERYVGDITGPEVTKRLADFTMRVSILSPLTYAGRRAFGVQYFGTLADTSKYTWKEIGKKEPMLKESLERAGIDEAEWDIIRATPFEEYKGAEFFSVKNLEQRADLPKGAGTKLATKILTAINQETNKAVPSTSIEGRAFLQGDQAGGTFRGEVLNSFAMYKSFSFAVWNTWLWPAFTTTKGRSRKYKHLANLIISTTLMGALAYQLKQISRGKDPMPMNTGEFWRAAFIQGGGGGVFTDFALGSSTSKYDMTLGETIAGPVFSFFSDLLDLTFGNLAQLNRDEKTNAAGEAIKFAGRYTPGSSLWYTRLAGERLLYDQMQYWADPDYSSKIRRKIRRDRKLGQDYWWRPGKTEPDRPPDLSNMFED